MELLLILYSFFLGIFIHYWRQFMPEVLYLHQTFTECLFDYCTYFGMSICQAWLQVMEGSLIQLRSLDFGFLFNYEVGEKNIISDRFRTDFSKFATNFMILKWNLVLQTYFIVYQLFTLRGILHGLFQVLKTDFILNIKLVLLFIEDII